MLPNSELSRQIVQPRHQTAYFLARRLHRSWSKIQHPPQESNRRHWQELGLLPSRSPSRLEEHTTTLLRSSPYLSLHWAVIFFLGSPLDRCALMLQHYRFLFCDSLQPGSKELLADYLLVVQLLAAEHIHTHACACAHTHVHTRTRTRTHTHTHTHTHTQIYINTSKHTWSQRSNTKLTDNHEKICTWQRSPLTTACFLYCQRLWQQSLVISLKLWTKDQQDDSRCERFLVFFSFWKHPEHKIPSTISLGRQLHCEHPEHKKCSQGKLQCARANISFLLMAVCT